MKTRQNHQVSKESSNDSQDIPQNSEQRHKGSSKINTDVKQYRNKGKKGPNHKDLKCIWT